MKRITASFLLLCTVFLLCACPGGGPVTPPVGEVCPDCGKEPCECPEPKPPVGGVTVSPEDADYTLVFGAGAAIDEAGDTIFDRSPILSQRTYDAAAAVSLHIARFFSQVTFDGGVYASSGLAATPLSQTKDAVYGGSLLTALIFDRGLEITACEDIVFRNVIIAGDITIKSSKSILFENVQFDGRVTVSADSEDVAFNACRLSSLNNAGTDTFLVGCAVPFSGVGVANTGDGLYVENCRFEGTGTAISSTGDGLEVRTCTVKTDESGIGLHKRVAGVVVRSAKRDGWRENDE